MQGVFQDPFSSYNPIFKADRVFTLLRGEHFSGLSGSEWSARVQKALEDVNLNPGDVLGKYPHQLSGGQLQRMLIARALLLDIRFLVADEIISMLDASTRIDVLNLLGDLKSRGLGVLFITHDLSLGNYISDRTVILRRGSVVEIGRTEQVFGNPLHPYTRSLLASVPQLHKKWKDVEAELGAVPQSMPRTRRPTDDGALIEVEPVTSSSSIEGSPRDGSRRDHAHAEAEASRAPIPWEDPPPGSAASSGARAGTRSSPAIRSRARTASSTRPSCPSARGSRESSASTTPSG